MPFREFASPDVIVFYNSASENISAAETSYDLLQVMKKIALFFNFHHFIVLRLSGDEDAPLSELILLTNWSPELIRAYDDQLHTKDSPIIGRLRQTTLPIPFDIEITKVPRSGSDGGAVTALFSKFNHHNGIYLPTVSPSGLRGAVGFSGQRDTMSEGERAGLAYLSAQVFERITKLMLTRLPSGLPQLSERELDCVRWTAAGKTAAETATILGLTANTVNHYLASASSKLETVNKAHTVARAMRLGLID